MGHIHTLLGLHACRGLERGSFDLTGSQDQFPQDAPVVPRHLALDVSVRMEARTLEGTCTITLEATQPDVRQVRLDAREMTIQSVHRDGSSEPLRFVLEGGKLDITLDTPVAVGKQCVLRVAYRVERPRLGLFFVAPDAAHPNKPRQAWTQSQDDDAPYWYPCIDAPHLKCTTEIRATVEKPYRAISNGPLQGPPVDNVDGTHTWHYRMEVPHSAYLVSLVVGEFSQIDDAHGPLPVRYFVAPGREDEAKRSFGRTPAMVALFEEKFGVRFPFAEYNQVAVVDYYFGGMEHSGCTTQTDRTLHDARAHLDFTSDDLVAHELAHQWFGDLVTCRSWSEGWLNEGFATWCETLWKEHDLGRDEALYAHWLHARYYLDEDGRRYRRPIVTRRYQDPIDLFDKHLYEKGARVVHMLRAELGDHAFFAGLRRYLTRHGQGAATTTELCRALEEESGRSLERFFDDWVHGGGHPELTVEYSHDAAAGVAWLTVTQAPRQEPKRPWQLKLPVRIHCGAEVLHQTLSIDQERQRIPLAVPSRPTRVVVDPEDVILKTLRQKLPEEMLIATLREDESCMARIRAAFALQDFPTTNTFNALEHALLNDRFWGVRADCATVLGEMRGTRALAILVDALGRSEHPKVRRTIVRALGNWRDARAADALIHVLQRGDASYFVEAEAATALGRTRDVRAFGVLTDVLGSRESWLDVVRAGCVGGLGELREVAALDVVKAHAAYGRPLSVRLAALIAMARLGEGRTIAPEVARELDGLSGETDQRVLSTLTAAAEALGDPSALSMLDRLQRQGPGGIIKRRAEEAARKLRAGAQGRELTERLRDELDRLKEETRGLRDRVLALEAQKKTGSTT